MSEESNAKSIDFDQVADLYDSYVQVDFDVEFWKQEAATSAGKVLELMCGTGRIGMPLIEAGVSYTGLDYCRNRAFYFAIHSQELASRLVSASISAARI